MRFDFSVIALLAGSTSSLVTAHQSEDWGVIPPKEVFKALEKAGYKSDKCTPDNVQYRKEWYINKLQPGRLFLD
jgi:hypothetical protein